MLVDTNRFGPVECHPEDLLTFPQGLIGMENCQKWVLLADSENTALGWLQSVERRDLALAVVSPRRFVPDYQLRISARDLEGVGYSKASELQVLVILSRMEDSLAVNLKAPVVFCLQSRQGRQVVAKDDHEVQYVLGATVPFRRSA
ncbi:MAG: flagellar assembly protein FliW [Planctomycetales bacterium]|nr:flagellar assembly protein FliW [Planctomycetales bacterium]